VQYAFLLHRNCFFANQYARKWNFTCIASGQSKKISSSKFSKISKLKKLKKKIKIFHKISKLSKIS
jgi:hypothetical protein